MSWPRQRSRSSYVYGYSAYNGVVGGDTRTRESFNENMTDVVGAFGQQNPWYHSKVEYSGSQLFGKHKGVREYFMYPTNFYTNSYPHLSGLPEGDEAAWARFIAGTAPRRANFLAPAFLAELKDVPNLIRYGLGCVNFIEKWVNNPRRWGQIGGILGSDQGLSPEFIVNKFKPTFGNALSMTGKLGQANLALRFGVAPFVSDLKTALRFTAAVEQRRKELNKLQSKGGLSRRWELGKKTDEYTNINQVMVAVMGASADCRVFRSVRRWGTMRYFPKDESSLPQTDAEIMRELTGFTVGGALLSVYEVTPWSWLADYFSNLGNHLAATVNTIGIRGAGVLCTEFRLEADHGPDQVQLPDTKNNWFMTPGHLTKLVQHRTVRTTTTYPAIQADLLGSGQLSILGSLLSSKVFK